jgi:energy-coupling factor transporter ATP-binding protein EcfA2
MPAPREDFAVLPGMEVNVRLLPPLDQLRVHILAIFRPGTTVDRINRIFHDTDVGGETDRDARESEIKGVELAGFVRKIDQAGGLCILAHVDTAETGLRYSWQQTAKDCVGLVSESGRASEDQLRKANEHFKTLVAGLKIHALEVRKPEHRKHYEHILTQDGGVRSIPVLLSLDAHCLEELARADRYCHVKMTEVSFDGLTAALKMPHTRIRFRKDLPTAPSQGLIGVCLSSPDSGGFFRNAVFAFSDNLNCVIGPRGSGKSALIDALRYVFGYNLTLDREVDPSLNKAIRARQQATLKDTLIRVFYRVNAETTHVLEAAYDPKSDYATKVYTLDGHSVGVDNVEKSGQYPLRLFGWSEVESIGREPIHQRELVDRLIEGLRKLLDERERLRDELKRNGDALVASAEQLSRLFDKDNQLVTHFTEYTEDFARLNTPEVQARFASLDLAKRKERATLQVTQALDTHADNLNSADFTGLSKTIDGVIQSAGPDVADWWKTSALVETDYAPQITLAAGSHVQTQSAIGDLRQRLKALGGRLAAAVAQIEQELRSALAADTQAQVTASHRAQAESRLQKATANRDQYLDEYKEFEALLTARNQLIADLEAKQLEISGARNTRRDELVGKLNQFRTDKFSIDLQFKSGGDRAAMAEWLAAPKGFLATGAQYKSRKWPELLSQVMTPCEFARRVWARDQRGIATCQVVAGEERTIEEDEAEQLISKRHPLSHHAGANVELVDVSKLKMLIELESIPWDDLVHITLNGQPVNQLSPGQRSSAMLPLIALSQVTPLVIDQPEDNLDQRLVGEVLAGILADLKERRQVIVSTHNPNLVVSGDAEQVIVLDAISHCRGQIVETGSIDSPAISGHVIDILEGGREAFSTRKIRYGL